MTIQFQQEDTLATCALVSYCSPNQLNNDRRGVKAVPGGVPGTNTQSQNIQSGVDARDSVWFECIPTDGDIWNAGGWTIRFNVLSVIGTIVLASTEICRINAGCVSLGTIGSNALGISVVPGVLVIPVAGAAVPAPGVGDKIMVILGFRVLGGGGAQLEWRADQLIDAPFQAVDLMAGSAQGQASVAGPLVLQPLLIDPVAIQGSATATMTGLAFRQSQEGKGHRISRRGDKGEAHVMPERID